MRQMGIHSKSILTTVSLAACLGCAVLGTGSAAAGPPTLAPVTAVCDTVGGTLSSQEGFLMCTTSGVVLSDSAVQAAKQLCTHAYKTPGGDPGLFFWSDTSWLCDLTPR